MLRKILVLSIPLLLLVAAGIGYILAQDPADEPYGLQPIVTDLEQPLFLVAAPDDSGRLFVLEQPGRIRIIDSEGNLLSTPFLDLVDKTGITANERGLLGFAFHPDFANNGTFYIDYTRLDSGDTVVSRYQISADDPNRADPASETIIIEIDQPYGNHNGGMIAFGPDGYLYIGMGDGGSAGDPLQSGQNSFSLLGALLRIDVDHGDPYAIPDDNPFADGQDGLPELWAIGLRNPWRFSFDIDTNDLYIADVGQNQYEEVNFQPADSTGGENYGWNIYEGNHLYSGIPFDEAVFPVAEYSHSEGCSVTGGYVYRGEAIPALQGYYLYGDYCSGTVWWLKQAEDGKWEHDVLFDTDMQITSFGQDTAGEIYIVDRRGGVYQVVVE
ncbi:MAG: PQQ-dependent sugar dehydrogenase [Anaerolineales bacterium]|nr:PQQ-dependent sugar dehydrogenase [Anaerolineales bacterium]